MDIDMPPRCYITLMPLEMVSMILSQVPSPRDILALARTSKHFFKVLVNNKETDPIWRDARARCPPCPIPNFTPNFTEASFAALLFDFKTCEVRIVTRPWYERLEPKSETCAGMPETDEGDVPLLCATRPDLRQSEWLVFVLTSVRSTTLTAILLRLPV